MLDDEEIELYQTWTEMEDSLESDDLDDEAKKSAKEENDKTALQLIRLLAQNDDLPDDYRNECSEIIAGYEEAIEELSDIFNKHTDDEDVKERVREEIRKNF